ncbi:hypothetical protein ES703_64359 [subsurface metagenome]
MPASKDDKFFSSKLKIERAKRHIRELSNEIVDYLKTKPFRVVVEKDPDSSNHLWTLRVKNEVPSHLSGIIGDAIHNLRASLDLLASDLVSMAGGNTKNVYFPFGDDADGFEEMIKKRHLDRAGDDVVEIVRSLKPYKGGNEFLRAIHDLDIIDKHKTLIPVAHYAGIKNFQMLNASGPMLTINNMHCGPIRDGMVLMSLPPARNVRIGQTFQPSLKITLNEGPLARDKDIAEALNELSSLTEGIIRTFEEHFETKGA